MEALTIKVDKRDTVQPYRVFLTQLEKEPQIIFFARSRNEAEEFIQKYKNGER